MQLSSVTFLRRNLRGSPGSQCVMIFTVIIPMAAPYLYYFRANIPVTRSVRVIEALPALLHLPSGTR